MNKKLFCNFLFALTAGIFTSHVLADENTTKKLATVDSSFSYEFTINRPASEVWPHLLALGKWAHKGVTFKPVSGSLGTEGQLLTITLQDENTPAYYYKVIEATPLKKIAYKMYPVPGHDSPFDDVVLFDSVRLVEQDGKTKIFLDSNGEFQSSAMTYIQLKEWVAELNLSAKRRWKEIQEPSLRKLITGTD